MRSYNSLWLWSGPYRICSLICMPMGCVYVCLVYRENVCALTIFVEVNENAITLDLYSTMKQIAPQRYVYARNCKLLCVLPHAGRAASDRRRNRAQDFCACKYTRMHIFEVNLRTPAAVYSGRERWSVCAWTHREAQTMPDLIELVSSAS